MLSPHQEKEKLQSQGTSCCGQTGVSLGIHSEAGAHTRDCDSPRKRMKREVLVGSEERGGGAPAIHPPTGQEREEACVLRPMLCLSQSQHPGGGDTPPDYRPED